MAAAADEILREALPAEPTDLVAVGGTASNLLKVTAAGTADRILTPARLAEARRDPHRATRRRDMPSDSSSTRPGRGSSPQEP